MNDLGPLHALLRRIGRRRRMLRWSIGLSGIVAGGCVAWLALFALDWGLQLSAVERAVALIATGVALGWAARRFVLPWLLDHETELRLAILLQNRERIDTDLVAALQFEAAEWGRCGSSELQAALIDRVAGLAPFLPLKDDIPRRIVRRRALCAAVTLACAAAIAWAFPEHIRVFRHRLLLQTASYPTATRIDEIQVAGQSVSPGPSQAEVRCPRGMAVDVRVIVSGRIPSEGLVHLSAVESRQSNRLPLLREGTAPATFLGSLPPLAGDCECRIRIGDASVGPIVLRLVHPPEVRLGFEIREPNYGGVEDRLHRWQEGVLQIAVPEGSWVRPWLIADRPLKRAVLRLGDDVLTLRPAAAPPSATDAGKAAGPGNIRNGREHGQEIPERHGTQGQYWTAEPAATLPIEVTEPMRLEFTVEDCDGSPPLVIQAVIRPRPDQPPRILAESRVSLVLPRARPTTFCRASDDRGLVRIDARAERVGADGTAETLHTWTLWRADHQATRELEERFALDLSATGAGKGDRLHVYLLAVEQGRDGQQGRTVESTPITFEVTDEQGILAAMAELDRKSAEQLQQMIDRQLEVGGSP